MRQPQRQAKVTLRLPPALHRRLVELAREDRRSLNTFLTVVLEAYVRSRDGPRDQQSR